MKNCKSIMYELHENEQYFFDEATIEELTEKLSVFENLCCLCAPLLGKSLRDKGTNVSILDIDKRFDGIDGFRKYDIYKPEWINEKFDLIFCDPPFFNVSLSQLFDAIRLLAHHDFTQKIAVCYLKRRENAIIGTFAKFMLRPTGYLPQYQTLQKCERNKIEMYASY